MRPNRKFRQRYPSQFSSLYARFFIQPIIVDQEAPEGSTLCSYYR